ncbi:MAG: glycosyltransferase family 2 protein [Proteobacteria bacterium]|nr:glycosyltransferase family 2 protein [Pseudomonadota bacterium]
MINPAFPKYKNTPVSDQRANDQFILSGKNEIPILSIITPFYDTGKVFHDTAKSIIRHTLQHWEWIIVNDCSTDADSIEVLDSYRVLDPRIRVIDLAINSGPGAARNVAIRESRAGLIFQLDADDLIEPTALEKCAWYLKTRPEVSFVKGYSVGFGSHTYLWRQSFHSRRKMLQENLVTITTMLRRDLFEEVGGYDESLRSGLEDWEFWIRCASKGRWGSTIPEFLDWYRRRLKTDPVLYGRRTRQRLRHRLHGRSVFSTGQSGPAYK